MTETNLFETLTGDNQTPDPLAELVGDGKKFKTAADLAKGKLESDKFITQLQNELKGVRDELAARTRMEELLDRIETASNQTPDPNDDDYRRQEPSRQTQREDLDTLLEQKLSEHERRRVAQSNIREVREKLEQSLGAENFDSKLKARVRELGLDEQTISDLAGRSPTAALKLLGVTQQATGTHFTPPSSSLSLPTGSMRAGEDRTYSYYQKLRIEQPKVYSSDKIQSQMHADAQRLGEQFFDVTI